MERLKELQKQNQEISELCNVLRVLLNDNSVCDTAVARELFERFTTKVKVHLALEENTLYAELLAHSDSAINNMSRRFMNNSRELRRIFEEFERKWCRDGVKVSGNSDFTSETSGIFNMILKRIRAESEEFFPVVDAAMA